MIIMSLRVFEKQSPVYEEIAHLHCNTPFGQAVCGASVATCARNDVIQDSLAYGTRVYGWPVPKGQCHEHRAA
jgi:hypothetical protein